MNVKLFAIVSCALLSSAALAGEVRLVSTVAAQTSLEELKPAFERATPHKLNIRLGTSIPLERDLQAGAPFDVTILTPGLVGQLAKAGKVDGASQVDFARTGLALAGPKGAPVPDIATAESLKRTLMNANSVSYSKEGQSGIAAAKLLDQLGIREQLVPRTVFETRPAGPLMAIEEGKAELGFGLVSEIVARPTVANIGPVPSELQSYMVLSAGVSSSAQDAAAAKAFVEFLRTPEARAVMQKKGLEGL